MNGSDIMVTIPLSTFKDGIKAMADLDSIRAMLTVGGMYCSDAIKAVLDLPVKETAKLEDGYDNPAFGEE